MNNRSPIQDELNTVAPGLAYLPVGMPYIVPKGYFETLAASLIDISKNEDFALRFLDNTKQMPYRLPLGYFENLSETIVEKINKKQAVPEGYFDTLPSILLNKVRNLEVTQELETVAPFLNTISKEPVQFVPEGYFDNLQPFAGQVIKQQPPVVSIKKKSGWLKYAAAASVVLFLSFGAYKYFDKKQISGEDVTKLQNVNVDKQLAQLDDATLENYLHENESVTESSAAWYNNIQESDIENQLQEFTEQELQQQLLENPDLSATTKNKKT